MSVTIALSQAIHRYLLPWRQHNWPLGWNKLFPKPQPLVLEIGFGNGQFLLDQASRNPDKNFIGIERSWGSIQRLVRQLHQANLDNALVLDGDAVWQMDHLFAPDSLHEVFINFSDPWPKERHHSRRLIQTAFMQRLSECMEMNAQVTVATDHSDFAAWINDVLINQTVLQSIHETPVVHKIEGRSPTKYEAKALAQGSLIHYFVWHKATTTPSAHTHAEKVTDMPNVLFHGEASAASLLDTLQQQSWLEQRQGVDVIIKVEGVYQAFNSSNGMLELLVKEGNFSQQIGVLVSLEGDQKLLLKPASIGFPRPTWGVKRAIWHLANTLLQQHPQLKVVSSSVGEFGRNRLEGTTS